NGVEKVEFYLGDALQFVSTESPYNGQLRIPINAKSGTKYDITAYVYDVLGYRNSSMISVQVKNDDNNDNSDEVQSNPDISVETTEVLIEENKPEEQTPEEAGLAN
ncbi:MAG: hypothetical protein UW70_C0101G0001, partial [Candidatus Peregrinibacteria bacterium GW2011_GWA2_44_7]